MSAGREGVPASPSVAGEGPDLREFAASLRRGEIEDAFQALHGVALEDRQRDLDVPGFALALRDGTRGPWAGAFGDWHRARGVALALDQALPAGSLGKPVAGALAMQAVAAGQLELDGSANAYLQRARLPDAPCGPGDAITVRHLLAHRAGLEPSGFLGYRPDEPTPDALSTLGVRGPIPPRDPVRRVHPPGRATHYSGAGYVALQILLEDLLGAPFAALAAERIFAPLAMHHSHFRQPTGDEARRDGRVGRMAGRDVYRLAYPELAASGLITTAPDLLRFVTAYQHALAGEPDALVPAGLARSQLAGGLRAAGQEARDEPRFGLAWQVDDEDAPAWFFHGGGCIGFAALVIGEIGPPTGRALALVSNGFPGGRALGWQLAEALAHAFAWPRWDALSRIGRNRW